MKLTAWQKEIVVELLGGGQQSITAANDDLEIWRRNDKELQELIEVGFIRVASKRGPSMQRDSKGLHFEYMLELTAKGHAFSEE